MEKNNEIILILRIPERNLSHSTLYIEKSLETIRQLKTTFKINWNISHSPLCEDPRERSLQISSELQARFYFTEDCLIPMGFTGAKHPLLKFEDFEKEIKWTHLFPEKNIFKTALKDKPKVIMPYCFDFKRNDFLNYYKNEPED